MDEDAGLVLAAAMTGGIFVVLLVLLVVVLVRRRWLDREGVASGRGFVLFGVCCQDGNQGRFVRTSLARSRQRAARGGEEANDEPDEGELERWKKMFSGPIRCLSTIEEATEKGTSTVTTPAFCSPAASPDRRDARTVQTASAGVLKS